MRKHLYPQRVFELIFNQCRSSGRTALSGAGITNKKRNRGANAVMWFIHTHCSTAEAGDLRWPNRIATARRSPSLCIKSVLSLRDFTTILI